jgi:uncharacterized protein (TIGR01244 family)
LEDKRMAEYALLRYANIPIADRVPTQEQVAELQRLLAEADNAPVLIYGARDQAATAWALVRAASGVPPELAWQEGLTAGLRETSAAVRERLGLPASVPVR